MIPILSNRLKEKKGDFTGLLFFVASIAACAIFLIIAGFVGFEVTQQIKSAMSEVEGGASQEINDSFDATINVSRNTLPLVWFVLFGGLLMSLFVTAYFTPTHPVFAVFFAFLLIIAIVLAIAVSNAYELVAAQPSFANVTSIGYRGIGFFMSNLAWVAFIIGIIIMVIAYAKPKQNDITPA